MPLSNMMICYGTAHLDGVFCHCPTWWSVLYFANMMISILMDQHDHLSFFGTTWRYFLSPSNMMFCHCPICWFFLSLPKMISFVTDQHDSPMCLCPIWSSFLSLPNMIFLFTDQHGYLLWQSHTWQSCFLFHDELFFIAQQDNLFWHYPKWRYFGNCHSPIWWYVT